MKKSLLILLLLGLLLAGCGKSAAPSQIAATTLPVYEFTSRLCSNTPLTVTRLVTEEVSCLHDYSLNVKQVKAAEAAQCIVISGAGLEGFLEDILLNDQCIDASDRISLIEPTENNHHHEEEPAHHHEHEEETVHNNDPEPAFSQGHDGHHHEQDPHIWLSPVNAMVMVENICHGLMHRYPEHTDIFLENQHALLEELTILQEYGEETLANLSCRDLITFHDGFAYLADAYQLTILDAIEEESGSEASAKELIHMIEEVEFHHLPAVFTEKSGSVSAAQIISRETGAKTYALDMAMAGDSYFDAMYHNINTLKEALQ